MLTLSATAHLAIWTVAGGQLPNLDLVNVAGGSDNIEKKFRDLVIFLSNLLSHNEHARTQQWSVIKLKTSWITTYRDRLMRSTRSR